MPYYIADWRPKDVLRTPLEGQLKKRHYKQYELLGEGSFGQVLRAEWRNPDKWSDKRDIALKIIDKARVNESVPVEAEIAVLQNLQHEHIVRLHESFETQHRYYLAFELATGGELFTRIRRGRYPEPKAAACLRQILSGIAYLHANRIVHRDIKPENIMYRNPSPTSPIVIVDFGIAKFIDNLTDADGYSDDESGSDDDTRAAQAAPGPVVLGEEQADSKMAGTFGYASPEALQGKRPACKMDMWSIGIIAYQIIGGYKPFRGRSREELIRQTLKGRVQFEEVFWSTISDSAKDFVKGLLTVDPEKRLSAEEALQHPWITSMAPASSSTTTSRTNSPTPSPTRPNPPTPISVSTSLPSSAQVGPSSQSNSSHHAGRTSPIAPTSLPDTPETDRMSLLADSSDQPGLTEDEEEEVDSDDEGFFTPDEGEEDEYGAIRRRKSRKSLRKRQSTNRLSAAKTTGQARGTRGQVPDAKQTLAVDTSVNMAAMPARPAADIALRGASAPSSSANSQQSSPTLVEKKGGFAAAGLKGMMGKMGLGMGKAK